MPKKTNATKSLFTIIGFILLIPALLIASGVTPIFGSTLCPINTATIQINQITATPNPVGVGQDFTVSGSMFAGTGCPTSDAGTNYATYLVYWWVAGLSGYSGQFTVNAGGGFSITNIPTISTAGSYTIVVSPYSQTSGQNTGNVCTPTSPDLTCTNAETTVTVQSTQAVTYPFQFNFAPLDPGATMVIKSSSGATQYLPISTSSTPIVMLTAGDYSYTFQPNNDPSVVGTTCLDTRSGTFSVSSENTLTQTTTLSYIVSTHYCGASASSITFNVEPTVSGTVTLNGVTKTISNGQVTFSNVASGTYSYTVNPSSSYPNCLYAAITGSIYLPYAQGSVNIPLQASNSQTCQAPTTITQSTTLTSSHTGSVYTTTNAQGSTITVTSSSKSCPNDACGGFTNFSINSIYNLGIGGVLGILGFAFIYIGTRKK